MINRNIIELKPQHRGVKSHTFTGRGQGVEVRKEFALEKFDKDDKQYEIHIPNETTSFNPSFFLGLFFNSIKNLDGYENFEKKYKIVILEENESLKFGLEGDFAECKRQAINEFNHKTGISLWD